MGTVKNEVNNHVQAKNNVETYGKIVLTLKNCILPEEKFSPTPSQIDGLDAETETDLRILGCELMQTAGILLRLPQVAMATAQVLFQRFYYSKSFVRQNFEVIGMGCLYLASKIEEAPRRIRDVINVYHHIKQVNSQKSFMIRQFKICYLLKARKLTLGVVYQVDVLVRNYYSRGYKGYCKMVFQMNKTMGRKLEQRIDLKIERERKRERQVVADDDLLLAGLVS